MVRLIKGILTSFSWHVRLQEPFEKIHPRAECLAAITRAYTGQTQIHQATPLAIEGALFWSICAGRARKELACVSLFILSPVNVYTPVRLD